MNFAKPMLAIFAALFLATSFTACAKKDSDDSGAAANGGM